MPSPSKNPTVTRQLKDAWNTMSKHLDEIESIHGRPAVQKLLATLSKDPSMALGQALFIAVVGENPGRNVDSSPIDPFDSSGDFRVD